MQNKTRIPGKLEGTYSERLAIYGIDMPPRYARISKWIMDNWLRAPFATCRQIQKETNVYKHEVVDFAKRLRYTGWEELKQMLLQELTEHMEDFYGKRKKQEIALKVYQHAVQDKKIELDQCPKCEYPEIFQAKNKWYFRVNSGYPEPEISYCPSCGKEL